MSTLTMYGADVKYQDIKLFTEGYFEQFMPFICSLATIVYTFNLIDMHKKTIIAASFFFCVSNSGYSQNDSPTSKTYYWGTDIGSSLGSSTLKSLGANKTNLGLKIGAFGGLNINRILSTELSLSYSNMKLSAYDCCQNLWLCEGNRYFAPVSGKQNYAYNDLYSAVNLYEVGSKLNIDFIKIKHPNARLMATLSPSLSLIASTAKVKTLSTEENITQTNHQFHLGIGAEAGIGYRFNKKLSLKLYSGIAYLTNKNFDAMPNADHRTNLIWNNGLKFIFALNKKACKNLIPVVVDNTSIVPQPQKEAEIKVAVKDSTVEIKKDTLPQMTEKPVIDIPEKVVYFKLNRHRIYNKTQLNELNKIVEIIKNNPQSSIRIDGWADKSGTKKWNELISLRRAEFIRSYLIKAGIDENRILHIQGNGVDYQNEDNLKNTRRTVIKIVTTEKTK